MSETSTRRSPAVGTRPVALLTALQLGAVGTYWYLGERAPRTHLVRLVDDIVLHVAAPVFAGLALLGLLTLVRGVPPATCAGASSWERQLPSSRVRSPLSWMR